MTAPIEVRACPRWHGFDRDFHERVLEAARTPEGAALREKMEARFLYSEGKPFLLGPPALVKPGLGAGIRRLTRAYHRAIQTIVADSREHEEVRRVLATPPELEADLARDADTRNDRVHICRLDLLLDPGGGFSVLETNANCPGGFVFSGICNRAWREFLDERGVDLPPALEHESKGFMAKWFLRVIEEETGERPNFLPLLRKDGGNRLELSDFTNHVRWEGMDCEELDPRELKGNGSGAPTWKGRPVTHAYLKLGMQPFFRMRADLDPFVDAVRERRLFVQNGQRGRWVGDNKLCLAIVSDPRFRELFDPADYDFLQEHVPWSRNAALLDREDAIRLGAQKDHYVLKRGHDTRGRSVIVGREQDHGDWVAAVDIAMQEGWLVQEFRPTTWIERDFEGDAVNLHDLAVGAINGETILVLSRSSSELRVNMARAGRMHPVFLGT